MRTTTLPALICFLLLTLSAGDAAAQRLQAEGVSPLLLRDHAVVLQSDDGAIFSFNANGSFTYSSWSEYFRSDDFRLNGMRCTACGLDGDSFYRSTSDCSSVLTNPADIYDPSVVRYRIPVVVHIIMSDSGIGAISDQMVASQIEILNEDFLAQPGTNGAPGTNVEVEFFLATEDPLGQPTSGITRHYNTTWYNDSGNYETAIGWDQNRYLNIYTNTAGGALGYAYLPSGGGVVGQSFDGVRILWQAFGRNAPIGAPYNLGRTATHEVGHYLGLYHTFEGGCADASSCASNGDLICDTNPESSPNFDSCARVTCGSQDPVQNYLDYSDDSCMSMFTPHQARRMRCTLENWRVDLAQTPPGTDLAPNVAIVTPSNGASFAPGLSIDFSASANDNEDGDLSSGIAWSSSLDGPLGGGASLSTTLSLGDHVITASVVDSQSQPGEDSIQLSVEESGGSAIQLSGVGSKKSGRVRVRLTWSGASTNKVKVFRNGKLVTKTGNDGKFVERVRRKGHGSLRYRLAETRGGATSDEIIVNY